MGRARPLIDAVEATRAEHGPAPSSKVTGSGQLAVTVDGIKCLA